MGKHGGEYTGALATRDRCNARRMKVLICDYSRGRLLEPTAYRHGQTIEGSLDDVLRVMGELFAAGLNVMLTHRKGREHDALLSVDDRGFGQR